MQKVSTFKLNVKMTSEARDETLAAQKRFCRFWLFVILVCLVGVGVGVCVCLFQRGLLFLVLQCGLGGKNGTQLPPYSTHMHYLHMYQNRRHQKKVLASVSYLTRHVKLIIAYKYSMFTQNRQFWVLLSNVTFSICNTRVPMLTL